MYLPCVDTKLHNSKKKKRGKISLFYSGRVYDFQLCVLIALLIKKNTKEARDFFYYTIAHFFMSHELISLVRVLLKIDYNCRSTILGSFYNYSRERKNALDTNVC